MVKALFAEVVREDHNARAKEDRRKRDFALLISFKHGGEEWRRTYEFPVGTRFGTAFASVPKFIEVDLAKN